MVHRAEARRCSVRPGRQHGGMEQGGVRSAMATRAAGSLLALLLLLVSSTAAAELEIRYAGSFHPAEQTRVEHWLERVLAAQASLVGPLPFEVMAYLRRGRQGYEPVYGGRTERFRAQGVYLHVDPSVPLETLLGNWKAPHEFSHLILPYVGRRHSWFSEGFASYMQFQVMHALGVLTSLELDASYRERLARARDAYGYPERSFVAAAGDLRARHDYPTLYWGGSLFFLQTAAELDGGDAELMALLRRYLAAGRPDRASLAEVLRELDAVAGRPLFTGRYQRWLARRGFPDLSVLPPSRSPV